MTGQMMPDRPSRPFRIPKKIAMINDIAGYGRCSTTVSLPIISAMQVQVCPVPCLLYTSTSRARQIQSSSLPLSASLHTKTISSLRYAIPVSCANEAQLISFLLMISSKNCIILLFIIHTLRLNYSFTSSLYG